MGNALALIAKEKNEPLPPPLRIIFVRHGQSLNNFNCQHSLWGAHHSDPPLTQIGRSQSLAMGRLLSTQRGRGTDPLGQEIDLRHCRTIYTSDMRRAVETGVCVSQGWGGGRSVTPVPFFSEMSNWGGYLGSDTSVTPPTQGQYKEQVAQLQRVGGSLDVDAGWDAATWRESQRCAGDYDACHKGFVTRVLPWLQRRHRHDKEGGAVVVVGHGRYLRWLLGIWARLKNTAVVVATYDEQKGFTDVTAVELPQRHHRMHRDFASGSRDIRCTSELIRYHTFVASGPPSPQ